MMGVGSPRNRTKSYCEDCIKDDYNKTTGANKVYHSILWLLLVGALGGSFYATQDVTAIKEANAGQTTDIAVTKADVAANKAAIEELKCFTRDLKISIKKEQAEQTKIILEAIRASK